MDPVYKNAINEGEIRAKQEASLPRKLRYGLVWILSIAARTQEAIRAKQEDPLPRMLRYGLVQYSMVWHGMACLHSQEEGL